MPEHLMLSFHGIPQRYFVQGDPYHCHCMKTARLVKEELGWEEKIPCHLSVPVWLRAMVAALYR